MCCLGVEIQSAVTGMSVHRDSGFVRWVMDGGDKGSSEVGDVV